jgi:hypothetical protein
MPCISFRAMDYEAGNLGEYAHISSAAELIDGSMAHRLGILPVHVSTGLATIAFSDEEIQLDQVIGELTELTDRMIRFVKVDPDALREKIQDTYGNA